MRVLDCFVPRNDVPADKKTKKIIFFLDIFKKVVLLQCSNKLIH